MRRLIVVFLALLAAATLNAGVLYQNAGTLLAGRGALWNWGLALVSAGLLGFALLILEHILNLTAPPHNADREVSQ